MRMLRNCDLIAPNPFRLQLLVRPFKNLDDYFLAKNLRLSTFLSKIPRIRVASGLG